VGQKSLKQQKRAIRRTAHEERDNIVSRYMTNHSKEVITASVSVIRQFNFKNRFGIAMMILFKPIKKPKNKKPEPESEENTPADDKS
jgi:hypothetical protein